MLSRTSFANHFPMNPPSSKARSHAPKRSLRSCGSDFNLRDQVSVWLATAHTTRPRSNPDQTQSTFFLFVSCLLSLLIGMLRRISANGKAFSRGLRGRPRVYFGYWECIFCFTACGPQRTKDENCELKLLLSERVPRRRTCKESKKLLNLFLSKMILISQINFGSGINF